MRGSTPRVQRASSTETKLVQIEKPVYGGSFLARDEGKALFVPLTLPGEQARVRIVDEKRGYSTAEIEEVVRTAPERLTARCRHFGACGGCHYQHTDYETQLKLKQAILRETLARGGVTAPRGLTCSPGSNGNIAIAFVWPLTAEAGLDIERDARTN